MLDHVAFVGDSVIYRTACTGAFAAIFDGHIIRESTVLPGAGYIEIASAGRLATALGGGTCPLGNIMFMRPLVLSDDGLFMECELSDHGPFEVRSGKLSAGWMYGPSRHTTGDSGGALVSTRPVQAPTQGAASVDTQELYDTFARLGLEYLLLTTYYLPLTTYYLLLTTYYLLLTTYYVLLTTYYVLLSAHYFLLCTHYSLNTTYYLLLTPYCVLLATCYLLLTTYYLLLSTYYLLLTTYYLLLATYYLPPTTYNLLCQARAGVRPRVHAARAALAGC